ncbi:MAG: ATP-dependent helicase HrpA, partial [Actinomycetota bacterium]|nr:ATP-dependent helicase HrpA [Actinomycetota bacterium]
KDGVALLEELGALVPGRDEERKRRLTPLGRQLAQLPVDPRLARMVVEADRNGCAHEVLVITAAMSIQDPRERPVEHQQAADDKHRRFADERSDFLAYWNLWSYLQDERQARTGNAFRRMCRAEFLHYLRVREWQDLVGQLRQVARSLGLQVGEPVSDADARRNLVHRSLLAGLLSHIGLWEDEKREYVGARGASFAAWPGSALFKKPPRWVMAGELVETSRLWGRDLGRIDPEWVEPLADHLVKRSYSEPHWSAKHGAVMAHEKVTLYGVPVVASRRVAYGRIDAELSRELFIRHALVEGDWRTHHAFFRANRELLDEVEELEHRTRRRDILVDDEELFGFYDRRIPAEVVSGRHFDAWWKNARRETPDLLDFERAMLVREDSEQVSAADYPDVWEQDDLALQLTYQFEPGTAADGVTAHVPIDVLNRLRPDGFDWQVPGLRLDLVTALIRSLPKNLRRLFVPAPGTAAAVLSAVETPDVGHTEPITDVMSRELRRRSGVTVPHNTWDWSRVPEHLRMTFRVEDETGATVGEGKDLAALVTLLRPAVRETVARAASGIERTGLTSWTFGPLPETFEQTIGGRTVKGFPALVDAGSTVSLQVLGSSAEAERSTWTGVRRLLALTVSSPLPNVVRRLDNRTKLALGHNPHGGVPALLDDCLTAALDELMRRHGEVPRDETGFAALRDAVRDELPEIAYVVVTTVAALLTAVGEIEARVSGTTSAAALPSTLDVRHQLTGLVHSGFVAETGVRRLPDVRRYLTALARRLDTLATAPGRDHDRLATVARVQEEYDKFLAELAPASRSEPAVRDIRWMIEELRVSLFAQTVGTSGPISEKRIYKAMDTAAG